jgi:CRP/FNR family transcriptional regulator, cyclic AMP receptor protein
MATGMECYSNRRFDAEGSAGLTGGPRLRPLRRITLRSASGDGPEVTGPAERRSTAPERDRQIRDALADSDVFGALADAELDRLIEQGKIATYRKGAPLFRRGDLAQDLMIVVFGRVKLSSTSPKGKEVLFDFVEPGHCFGEFALLEGRTRKLDATAVKASAVFALKSRHVLACLEEHPEVAVRTIRVLCLRLGRAMEMFEDRTQLGLSSRTARALLRLASAYGSHEGGTVRINFRISQAEIAALIGATREKVNRQLCAWCRSGILAVDEGHLTIRHPAALRDAAAAD